MVQIAWREIRSLQSSQRLGFEELCCQLAHNEPVPNAKAFTRKGAPDAGVECFWTLTSGDEWGWQAKFFVDGFGLKQWAECDDSVRTALDKHPRLTQIFFCFPCDFPDARVANQQSALARWDSHVVKWREWASALGRSVEFVRWDQHELIRRLSDPAHRGRLWFWFNATSLDPAWFSRAVKVSVTQADERYSRDLHFELPLADAFEALTRGKLFTDEIAARRNELAEALHQATRSEIAGILGEAGKNLGIKISEAVAAVGALPEDLKCRLDFGPAGDAVNAARSAAADAMESFWEIRQSMVTDFEAKHGRPPRSGELPDPDHVSYKLAEIAATLSRSDDFFSSEAAGLANRAVMMLKGDAGFGKTHLLCSVAERRAASGRPVVLLLAERFDGTEPWTNALQLLGLNCSREEFLGALDAAGEAVGCRALILIDAINEGEGVNFWNRHLSAMLAEISEYPHVSIAFSIRSPYVPQLGSLPSRTCITVTHRGFAGHVTAASRHFFQRYGLAEPNVPVLNPEFENPLFLKLVCDALRHHGRPEIPADLRSVTTLFGFILRSVNQRLAKTLDYDEAEGRVERAIDRLAHLMAEAGSEYLPLEKVRSELQQIHPSSGHSASLLQHLIAEHLLVRLPRRSKDGTASEVVRFTYQRLSDHLIVRRLLTGRTKEQALQLFRDGPFARYGSKQFYLGSIAGWLEALAIQLPEAYSVEIDQVAPAGLDDEFVRQAFIASLVWRRPDSFSVDTHNRVEQLLAGGHQAGSGEVLDTVLAVTACIDHPYNANWLDRRLRPMGMADRDATWSIYLFGKLKYESSVARLVEWAWVERPGMKVPDEVVYLAAQTLAWFLTSSDRFVRDRATKSLVAVMEGRLSLMEALLQHFSGVDEPYVQERLYAAAYGLALRGSSAHELQSLAQFVYDTIFRAGTPPPSVLLRDHARGIVDLAARRGLVLDFQPEKIIPPYHSDWPKAPPSLSRLATTFGDGRYDEADAGLRAVHHSVTGDDFNHYVVGDVHWWHSKKLTRRRLSPRRAYERLLETVSSEVADTLRLYAKEIASLYPSPAVLGKPARQDPISLRYVAMVDELLPRFIGERRARKFLTKIVPYLKDTWSDRWDQSFPVELFQRLILQRVLELGYTSARFSAFDRNISSGGRESRKPERIGKKYQWIAYDEFHARISDNFGLAESRTRIMDDREWDRGTWPDSFRDIDPSLLLRTTPRVGFGTSTVQWWTPVMHTEWNTENRQKEWLTRTSDLPPVERFLRVQHPDGSRWVVLNNFASWRRGDLSGTGGRSRNDRYEVHYIIRSYFVRRAHLQNVVAWGARQNWINDLLPSADHDFRRYLHEHYQTAHFEAPLEDDWVDSTHPDTGLPHPVLPTTSEYMCEHNNYDCSLDETVIISMPSRALATMAGLRATGRNGDFVDSAGKLIAFDPSTREAGHSALVFHEEALRAFLETHDLALVWTLLGEKNIYPPTGASDWRGRLTLLGIYSWTGGDIAGGFRTEFNPGRD